MSAASAPGVPGAAGAPGVPGAAGASRARFRFDGRDVPFRPGQSVGAALWADGVRSWRLTRFGRRPRGLFCGIGVCFDCLVTVDGRADERACLVTARPGMDVRGAAGGEARGAAADEAADEAEDGAGHE